MSVYLALIAFTSLTLSRSAYVEPLRSNLSLVGTLEAEESGPWGSLLEEWATGFRDGRQARIMRLPPTQGFYVTNRNDPGFNEWAAKTPPPPPPPGKIVNRPPNPYIHKEKPKPQSAANKVDEPPRKEVTETDLYLLGAIEKLVYRVDFMEKRLKNMEEMVYYMTSGNTNDPESEPCAHNFTRVGDTCYHFGHEDKYDWKTSNLVCRKLGGNLVEFETEQENRRLQAHLHTDRRLKGKDYWTGGLNPGLLWIWSNSARPVPDGNSTQTTETQNVSYIQGSGRCLKLSYNPALKTYPYFGFDCAVRQHYICELPETKISNEINKMARELKFKIGDEQVKLNDN